MHGDHSRNPVPRFLKVVAANAIKKAKSEGFEVEPRLLAARLDVSEDDVIEMESRLSQPDLSLNAPTTKGEGDATYGDFIAAPSQSAEEAVGDSQLRELFQERVEEFSADLDSREKLILDERILSEDPKTLAEIGEELGVSRERIRQLEARLVKRLREFVKEHMVDFDYYTDPKD